jgi:hypothetical protein
MCQSKMSKTDVLRKVESALKTLAEKDQQLLKVNVHERSITHKLAEYLQKEFPCLNVDCEYNRHLAIKKELRYIKQEELDDIQIHPDDLHSQTVFPDIIVHHRGDDTMNLLVIEVKKADGAKDTLDQKKLEAFTKTDGDYRYQLGLFLRLGRDRLVEDIEVYRCGKKEEDVGEWDRLREIPIR